MEVSRETRYFSSYENFDVHKLMLTDKVRTESYWEAIKQNVECFKGKTVLDVGCGTGILSLFAARAGAAKVYALEPTNIADVAKEIAEVNGFSHVIQVFKVKVEDFQLPEESLVDILISEWMGFYLLHESMINSIIYARDNLLAENGLIFPTSFKIFIAPCSLKSYFENELDFWKDVYGFSMEPVCGAILAKNETQPTISLLSEDDLLGDAVCLKEFNMSEVLYSDISNFEVKKFTSFVKNGEYQGVCIWFDCCFDGPHFKSILSTSPKSAPTHWKQTLIMLPKNQQEVIEEGDIVGFNIKFQQNDHNDRQYDIECEFLGGCEEHPIPCDCGAAKCLIISKLIEEETTNP